MQTTKKKIPRKITLSYLENAGLYYLQRYASTVENFKKVLQRKAKKSLLHHGEIPAETPQWIEDVAARYVRSGLLNDTVFAEGRLQSMRRKGYSKSKIKMTLNQKGVSGKLVETIMADQDSDDELRAAHSYAKRRRLGPYRTKQVEDSQRKDMATLARQGFSYDIIRKLIDQEIDFDDHQP